MPQLLYPLVRNLVTIQWDAGWAKSALDSFKKPEICFPTGNGTGHPAHGLVTILTELTHLLLQNLSHML
jgi:hypothetical protein